MKSLRFLLVALFSLLALSGCSKKSQPTQPGSTTEAQRLVSQANASLGAVIAGLVNGPEPGRPSDVDFHEPYGLYQQALVADPNNEDALFGVALLGLVSLSTDAQVNAAFDEWKAYLDAHVPFEVPATPSPASALGRGRAALRLPIENLALSEVAIARGTLLGGDPQISGVQAILESKALPKLAVALTNLGRIAADPGYQFIVTPEMQGDPGADPIEIDHTDILALRAGCGVLTAMCDVAVSYELSFAAYDSTSLVAAFTPGSGWMALRSGGATHMSHARLAILDAVTDGEGAIHSLLAETDPQDDDAIKIDPGDAAGAESLLTYLGHARTALNSGFSITADWDDQAATPDVPLEIHPASLFTNPVPDWKALIPAYTAGAVRRAASRRYIYNAGTADISVTIPIANYYSGTWTKNYSVSGDYGYGYGDAVITDPMQPLVHDRYKLVAGNPLWLGSYSGWAEFGGYLNPGTQTITVSVYESYAVAEDQVFVPTLTWDAVSYAAWTFPDPTFHGLLPAFGSTSQMLSTFGYDPSSWERTVVLDWTEFPGLKARRPASRGMRTQLAVLR
jgi:hypothetical protein